MLSTTAQYALRATLHLADREGAGPVSVEDIAAALGVPRNYLSKVLHTLVKRGLLRSVRGPHGGFELAVPAAAVSLHRVVNVFDEVEERRFCLLGGGPCTKDRPCPVHERWGGIADAITEFFLDTRVVDLLEGSAEAHGPRRGAEG